MIKKFVSLSLFIFFAVVVAVLVAGLVFNDRRAQAPKSAVNMNNSTTTGGVDVVLTAEEVARHASATDCWVIISGAVYNVTAAINSHSGGASTIIPTCGTDATQVFDTKGNRGQPHSGSAQNIMQSYLLGNLNEKISTSAASVTPPAPVKKGEQEDD
jgi:cytochrome b involved in lipid metabolism